MPLSANERKVLIAHSPRRTEPRKIRSELREEGFQYCSACDDEKPKTEFSGFGYCYACAADYGRKWYRENASVINRRRSMYRRLNREAARNVCDETQPIGLLYDDFEYVFCE